MTQSNILFIGMDVHKESIVISLADDDRSEVRRYGNIGGTLTDFKKTLRKLVSTGKTLFFCYEAGPTGYELYRFIVSQGHQCIVVAPSLIPKKPGDKIKTDNRDADNLTRLLRSGDLTAVFVPNAEDVNMAFPAQKVVFQEYVDSITEANERVKRWDKEIMYHTKQWRLFPIVESLMALRGVRMVVAVTIIAELGDLTRFENPKQLMCFLGLTPSEHSSGDKNKKAPLQKQVINMQGAY